MNEKTSGQGHPGQQGLTDNLTDYTVMQFLIEQTLARVRTATLVRVTAVEVPNDGLAPVGFVDAVPIVKQMDGAGKAFPHGTVFNLPYFRMQGGANAVICDPKAGDVGVAVICDRDISSVKATRAEAGPGSRRRFGLADGLFFGGMLNVKPTCYVRIKDELIEMTPDEGVTSLTLTPGKIRLVAAEIDVHATTILKTDANGNGTEITAATRTDYVVGSTNTTQPIHPPEVP